MSEPEDLSTESRVELYRVFVTGENGRDIDPINGTKPDRTIFTISRVVRVRGAGNELISEASDGTILIERGTISAGQVFNCLGEGYYVTESAVTMSDEGQLGFNDSAQVWEVVRD